MIFSALKNLLEFSENICQRRFYFSIKYLRNIEIMTHEVVINSAVFVLHLHFQRILNLKLAFALNTVYLLPKYLSKMDIFAWKNLKLVTYHSSVKRNGAKTVFRFLK